MDFQLLRLGDTPQRNIHPWDGADDSELDRNSGIPGTNTMLTPDASVGAIVLFGVKQQHTVNLFSLKNLSPSWV